MYKKIQHICTEIQSVNNIETFSLKSATEDANIKRKTIPLPNYSLHKTKFKVSHRHFYLEFSLVGRVRIISQSISISKITLA